MVQAGVTPVKALVHEAAELIAWGRGENISGKRERNGRILGDIIHATPVVVGKPRSFFATEDYQMFADYHEYRRRQVYVGANDGMLHAFSAETGDETWAFVPQSALPYFSVMADSFYCHRYTVDQTVSVRDLARDRPALGELREPDEAQPVALADQPDPAVAGGVILDVAQDVLRDGVLRQARQGLELLQPLGLHVPLGDHLLHPGSDRIGHRLTGPRAVGGLRAQRDGGRRRHHSL